MQKHTKKKREGDSESKKVKRKRREKTRMSFSPPSIWRYEERDIWYLPHRKRMIWPADAVLLPRPESCPRATWSYVELHVLDMPLTWEADQVVGLSPYDLPAPHEECPWR